jgi:hypothetical protein
VKCLADGNGPANAAGPDVGGRIYVEAPDGRLRPTGRYRRA